MWEVLLSPRQPQSTLASSPRVGIDGSRVQSTNLAPLFLEVDE